jgi:hypothetical protein
MDPPAHDGTHIGYAHDVHSLATITEWVGYFGALATRSLNTLGASHCRVSEVAGHEQISGSACRSWQPRQSRTGAHNRLRCAHRLKSLSDDLP